jgi:hypothetical protein
MKKLKSRQQEPGGGPDYQPGDIYSFRTSPVNEFSPQQTKRYAAVKILGLRTEGRTRRVCYVGLDGVFSQHPTTAQVSDLPWLRNTRFSWRGDPACICTLLDWENGLEDFQFVGRVALSEEDRALLLTCRSYGPWSGASKNAEGEWRWRNDRVAYEEDVARAKHARDQ